MFTLRACQSVVVGIVLSLVFSALVYAHGDSVSSGDLTSVAFAPNPNVPEFANAKGTLLIDLSEGAIQLADLQGFPFDTARNRILPNNVTSTVDPRFKNSDGSPAATSCRPASISESQEPVGP
jgi:hypothetical protein